MAFCFKRKESVCKAVRRLGRERIEKSLECLKDCSDAEAIHGVRKDIKKLRALLKLVKSELPKKAYRRQVKLLRKAAQHLSATRDAYVKATALKELTEHFEGELAPRALRRIRGPLQQAYRQQTKRFAKGKTARVVERILKQARKKLKCLRVCGKGWPALARGVKESYTRGRQAFCIALKDSSSENLHEWRKRAKDLWYQVLLLRRIWPEQMGAMAAELKALGELLGDDHDLVMLKQAASNLSSTEAGFREIETLNGLIDRRRHELQSAAMTLGARFYAEKPSQFCQRLGGYWRIWRGEKRKVASRTS